MSLPAEIAVIELSPKFPIFEVDVRPMLPKGWAPSLKKIALALGQESTLSGTSTTSREAHFSTGKPSSLLVVGGRSLSHAAPWLHELYSGDFLQLANRLSLGRFQISNDLQSSINLNYQRAGERYEWHVDSNPLTALLFASTLGADQGGALVFRSDPLSTGTSKEWGLRVLPKAGRLLYFDARSVAHAVEAVAEDRERLSVPMNYYHVGEFSRPPGLDPYLYRTGHV